MGDTYTKLIYHLVFSTKNRMPTITEAIRERLYEYIGGIIRSEGGSLIEIGGMPDHVHLLARLKADISVAEMVRLVKTNSSRWMHGLPEADNGFGWQSGYGAFTVSGSQIASVQRYIQTQEKHHARRSFKDELIQLLRKHQIEFDERYIFD
jgi:putative transposase